MGGKVFATGAKVLRTPRMIPEIYQLALRRTTTALAPLFPSFACPLEAPEKASFGDVDILLSLEGATFTKADIDDPQKTAVWAGIQKALGGVAEERINYRSRSFAVSWPAEGNALVWARQLALMRETGCLAESESKAGDKADNKADDKGDENPDAEDTLKTASANWFVQVDVELSPSTYELRWRAFKNDHGDLWTILGVVIRNYGLTVSDQGLFLRIPEMEDRDKKRARVFLTNSIAEVLAFLIRDKQDEWYKPFPSVDAMFAYAARCRFYDIWLAHEKERLQHRKGKSIVVKETSDHGQRMRTRPIYARWVDEYVPAQIAALAPSRSTPKSSRDEIRTMVREAAFVAFPGSRARYTQQLVAWDTEQARIFVKNTLIKQDLALPESVASALPAPQEGVSQADLEKNWRGCLRSALVKIVVNESATFTDREGKSIVPEYSLRDPHGVLSADHVSEWIGENWERVGHAAWARMCAISAERLRERDEKRLLQERLQEADKTEEEERRRKIDVEKENDAALRYG